MGNPVVHFEVVGDDADALQSFYADAFGWEMEPAVPGYAMALTGAGEGINGGVGSLPNAGGGRVTFYVEVEDLAAALERIASLGGKAIMPPTDIPDGPSIAMFADPEGHVVGLLGAGSRRNRS